MRYEVILLGALLLTLACAADAPQQFGGGGDDGASGGDSPSRRGTGGVTMLATGGVPAGTGGAAANLRPNGAGCIDAAQCTSGVCTGGMCCDQPDSSCGSCVGGYVVPKADDTICSPGVCQHGTPINHICRAGVCRELAALNCCTVNDCSPGTMCPAGQGCDIDTATAGHPAACMSWTGRVCDAQPPGR